MVVLALVALLGATVWWLSGGDASSPSTRSEAPVIDPPPAVVSIAKSSEPAAESVDTVATAKPDDAIEVCGGQWLKVGADGEPAPAELDDMVARAVDDAGTTGLAAMTSGGSPAAQAAASYFRVGRADYNVIGAASCHSPACVALFESWRREGEGQREVLAQLGLNSDDPQIYAWAYRACRGASQGEGSCAALSAARWSQLDPANAEPWLAVAAEAQARKDPAALDDAMFHIASADRHDSGFGALAGQLADHVPSDDAHLLGSTTVLAQAARIERLQSTIGLEVARYCSEKELGDANRRETCERIAAVFAARSTTPVARMLGERLGRGLGWPSERVAAARLRREAEMAVEERRAERSEAEPLACGSLRAELDRMRDVARYGEAEFYRREMAASGKSIAELGAESRRRQDRLSAQIVQGAAAASSAAPAASAASGTNVALGR